LAVDDDPGMLAILADSFSTDYNLRFAKDGAEALAKLGVGQEPDVVICDVMMDGMDGYGFLAALRASPFAHVPLIFLTAKSGRGDALRGLGGGAVDYIRKPFSTEELTAKVGSLLDSMELGYRAREAEMRERLLASLGEKARPEGQGGKKSDSRASYANTGSRLGRRR
jgi:CheY-like chemotaxis protein